MENLLYRAGTTARRYVSPPLRKLGLYEPVTRAYTTLLFLIAGDTTRIDIDGVTFRMCTETRDEYNIVNFGLRTEEGEVQRFLQDIRASDVVWDVGAHIGYWSCAAVQIAGREGEVIAFEPLPVNRERLEKNAEINNSRIDVRAIAISDESGSGVLSVPENKIAASMGSLTRRGGKYEEIEISMERGETIDAPSPTVMKIDVEGAELSVLEGMGNRLDNCRVIYVEVHPELLPDDHSVEDIVSFLTNKGYTVEHLSERDVTGTFMLRSYRA